MRHFFPQLTHEAPLQEVGFEVGWQQLQRLSNQELGGSTIDTLQVAVVQEEVAWQPVLLSGGKARGSLDQSTRQGLTGLENSLLTLLGGNLPANAAPEYALDNFTEVVIPQFNPRTGAWQMSA